MTMIMISVFVLFFSDENCILFYEDGDAHHHDDNNVVYMITFSYMKSCYAAVRSRCKFKVVFHEIGQHADLVGLEYVIYLLLHKWATMPELTDMSQYKTKSTECARKSRKFRFVVL